MDIAGRQAEIGYQKEGALTPQARRAIHIGSVHRILCRQLRHLPAGDRAGAGHRLFHPRHAVPDDGEYIRAGKLRPLAVSTATRSDTLTDLPTVAEFVSGYEVSS
jgi:hypothetical protein